MFTIEYYDLKDYLTLSLEQLDNGYQLLHENHGAGDDDFLVIRYRTALNPDQLCALYRAVKRRQHKSTVITEQLSLIRAAGKYTMLELHFANALDSIPLPRDAADELLAMIDAYHLCDNA